LFSRTTTRSTSPRGAGTPGYVFAGRRFAYRSNSLRSATFTERKPVPSSVVSGPLRATRLRRTDSSASLGNGVPCFAIAGMPISWTSPSIFTPVASIARRVASTISGPVPSPGIRVIVWVSESPSPNSAVGIVTRRGGLASSPSRAWIPRLDAMRTHVLRVLPLPGRLQRRAVRVRRRDVAGERRLRSRVGLRLESRGELDERRLAERGAEEADAHRHSKDVRGRDLDDRVARASGEAGAREDEVVRHDEVGRPSGAVGRRDHGVEVELAEGRVDAVRSGVVIDREGLVVGHSAEGGLRVVRRVRTT